MSKKIIITESQLKFLLEQRDGEQVTYTKGKFDPEKNVPLAKKREFDDKFLELYKILYKSRDISWNKGITKTLFNDPNDIVELAKSLINWTKKNPSYDPKLLKVTTALLFRESKGSPVMISYHPKEIFGKIHNYVGGNRSQGYAQIQPQTAKKYGIEMSKLFTYEGSISAIYKMLSINYEKAKKFYKGSNLTIFQDNKFFQVNGIDNDAALHITVGAHNAGDGIINNWCETNLKGIANICSIDKRKDIYKKNDGTVAITNKSKPLTNYFPNIGNVHDYMPQFRRAYAALENLPKILPQIKSIYK